MARLWRLRSAGFALTVGIILALGAPAVVVAQEADAFLPPDTRWDQVSADQWLGIVKEWESRDGLAPIELRDRLAVVARSRFLSDSQFITSSEWLVVSRMAQLTAGDLTAAERRDLGRRLLQRLQADTGLVSGMASHELVGALHLLGRMGLPQQTYVDVAVQWLSVSQAWREADCDTLADLIELLKFSGPQRAELRPPLVGRASTLLAEWSLLLANRPELRPSFWRLARVTAALFDEAQRDATSRAIHRRLLDQPQSMAVLGVGDVEQLLLLLDRLGDASAAEPALERWIVDNQAWRYASTEDLLRLCRLIQRQRGDGGADTCGVVAGYVVDRLLEAAMQDPSSPRGLRQIAQVLPHLAPILGNQPRASVRAALWSAYAENRAALSALEAEAFAHLMASLRQLGVDQAALGQLAIDWVAHTSSGNQANDGRLIVMLRQTASDTSAAVAELRMLLLDRLWAVRVGGDGLKSGAQFSAFLNWIEPISAHLSEAERQALGGRVEGLLHVSRSVWEQVPPSDIRRVRALADRFGLSPGQREQLVAQWAASVTAGDSLDAETLMAVYRVLLQEEVGSEQFSVRWTGLIEPRYSETYTFTAHVDDGIRLWIGDQELMHLWIRAWPMHTITRTMDLEAGRRYPIGLEYVNYREAGRLRLFWQSASQPMEIIASSQLAANEPLQQATTGQGLVGHYFADANLEQQVAVRVDPAIDFDWGNQPPLGTHAELRRRIAQRVWRQLRQDEAMLADQVEAEVFAGWMVDMGGCLEEDPKRQVLDLFERYPRLMQGLSLHELTALRRMLAGLPEGQSGRLLAAWIVANDRPGLFIDRHAKDVVAGWHRRLMQQIEWAWKVVDHEPAQIPWLHQVLLDATGRVRLTAARFLAAAYTADDRLGQWERYVDLNVERSKADPDLHVAWLLARACVEQMKTTGRSPLAGQVYCDQALALADSESARLMVFEQFWLMADHHLYSERPQQALSWLEMMQELFPQPHLAERIERMSRQAEQQRSQLASRREQNRQDAHQRWLDTMRGRLERARLAGDREAVRRYETALARSR